MQTARSPRYDDVNHYIGQRIRSRRQSIGVTQKQLADMLSITFQQVQRYEAGLNKVSASRLNQIATVLSVSPAYFFPYQHNDSAADELVALISQRDIIELLRALKAVGHKQCAVLVAIFIAICNGNRPRRRKSEPRAA